MGEEGQQNVSRHMISHHVGNRSGCRMAALGRKKSCNSVGCHRVAKVRGGHAWCVAELCTLSVCGSGAAGIIQTLAAWWRWHHQYHHHNRRVIGWGTSVYALRMTSCGYLSCAGVHEWADPNSLRCRRNGGVAHLLPCAAFASESLSLLVPVA